MERACSNCDFFKLLEGQTSEENKLGNCHAKAPGAHWLPVREDDELPAIPTMNYWPTVWENDFCGDHSPKV